MKLSILVIEHALHLRSTNTWSGTADVVLHFTNCLTGNQEQTTLWQQVTPGLPGIQSQSIIGCEEDAWVEFYFSDGSREKHPLTLTPRVVPTVCYTTRPLSILKKDWLRVDVQTNCPVRCWDNLWLHSERSIQRLPPLEHDKEFYILPWSGGPVELLSTEPRIRVMKQ